MQPSASFQKTATPLGSRSCWSERWVKLHKGMCLVAGACSRQRAGEQATGRPPPATAAHFLLTAAAACRRKPFVGAHVAHAGSRAQPRRSCRQHLARPAAVAQPTEAPPQQSPGAQAAPAAAPAGGFDWFDHWWPIAFAKDIPAKEPYGFELLETPM